MKDKTQKKIQKWVKEHRNILKILYNICENYFYVFSFATCMTITKAGMETGKINKAFLLILLLMIESSIYSVLLYASNLLFEKWKKAKEKDIKESEKKNNG